MVIRRIKGRAEIPVAPKTRTFLEGVVALVLLIQGQIRINVGQFLLLLQDLLSLEEPNTAYDNTAVSHSVTSITVMMGEMLLRTC